MSAASVTPLLRPDVLAGRTIAVAGGAHEVAALCTALGADVRPIAAPLLDEDAVGAAVAALGRIDVLVADADTPFRTAGGGLTGLRTAVDGTWNAIRAVATRAWIPDDAEPTQARVAIAVAPRPSARVHATAVGAALENTARTLSTEWARLQIVTTAVRPGDATTGDELAQLVAYLASPAGAYYSGTAFTLGQVASE